MKKMTVWDMMKDKAEGTVTLDDQGVIIAHDTGDELLDEAVSFKQTPEMFIGRVPALGFREVKDETADAPDADVNETDLDKALAAARTTVHPSRPGDIVRKAIEEESEIEFTGTGLISKADEEQQIVYGWAYVTHDKEGNVVVDKSGDFVDQIEEIEKTAVRFMLSSRNTDVGHANVKTGSIVESMVFTPEKIEKMGIPVGVVPSGWWIGTKVDDATWADYKAGRLTAFSVHGKGLRKAVD